MYYRYEISSNEKPNRNIIIALGILRIISLAVMMAGVILYQKLYLCIPFISVGLILFVLSSMVNVKYEKKEFTYIYIVDNKTFYIVKRYKNGLEKEVLNKEISKLQILNSENIDDYNIKFEVKDIENTYTVQSNMYLYTLLENQHDIS